MWSDLINDSAILDTNRDQNLDFRVTVPAFYTFLGLSTTTEKPIPFPSSEARQ